MTERACMTPDQFFDQLDKLFGSDDGYIPHLERIRALIEENQTLQYQYDMAIQTDNNKIGSLEQDVKDLQEENKKLQDEIKDYEFESNESGVIEQKLYREMFRFEAENEKLQDEIKEWKASDKHLNKCIDTIRDQYLEQKEENKKLQAIISTSAAK